MWLSLLALRHRLLGGPLAVQKLAKLFAARSSVGGTFTRLGRQADL
jgi:hypothetical protein